jgi:hypothetical protein
MPISGAALRLISEAALLLVPEAALLLMGVFAGVFPESSEKAE